MNSKINDWFDRFLTGNMSKEEESEFLTALEKDDELRKDFENYKLIIQTFQEYHQKTELEQKMNAWYTEAIRNTKPGKRLWWSVTYIAASVALVVTVAGIWFYDTLKKETKKQGQEITYLKKKLQNIQHQQNNLVQNFQKIQNQQYVPANSQSTGFLIAPHYLLTTYHSVQDADSVFIENDVFPRLKAKTVYIHKDLDVALLYVPALTIARFSFRLLNKPVDLGHSVFTLGFPTSQLVYNEGYISAVNGYDNDSAYYQITLPLNPGNSGGPLFDHQGDLIGMIVSKNTTMEGVAFALKSTTLYALKDSLPSDSIKMVWTKVFQKHSASVYQGYSQTKIQKYKPMVFKVFVYQKTI